MRERHKERKKKMLVLGNEKGEKSVINWLGLINRMHRDNDVNIFTSLYFFSFFLKYNYNNR